MLLVLCFVLCRWHVPLGTQWAGACSKGWWAGGASGDDVQVVKRSLQILVMFLSFQSIIKACCQQLARTPLHVLLQTCSVHTSAFSAFNLMHARVHVAVVMHQAGCCGFGDNHAHGLYKRYIHFRWILHRVQLRGATGVTSCHNATGRACLWCARCRNRRFHSLYRDIVQQLAVLQSV